MLLIQPMSAGISMKILNKESLMRIRLLTAAAMIFTLLACAGSSEQVKNKPEIKADSVADSFLIAAKTPVPSLPELKEHLNESALVKTRDLKQRLVMNGVPGEWFDQQLRHETFRIHPTIDIYFRKSAEKQVDYDKNRGTSWYFARLSVDAKIEKGKRFIKDHSDAFRQAEAKHGIHRELIAAIMGIETNFASSRQRGKFYAFNSLVSQYIFAGRMEFAVREITALYKFSQKTGHPPQYFTSSYAGAIGWGQFIPSSLVAFFIDANGVHEDTDPFSLEDTIFSVENYLYGHNLSGKNIGDYDSRYKAVFAYNHSDVYVKAVLFIYEGLRDCSLDDETGDRR